MSQILIRDLVVEFEGNRHGTGTVAIDHISLTIEEGTFVVLVGPSGCGKTTLLNAIAGLNRPNSGEIRIGNRVAVDTSKSVFMPSEKRGIGMVFQSYALWPHMSVEENVEFPLKRAGLDKRLRREKVQRVLSLVHCEHLKRRYAGQLSGGQQQRIALARAVVSEPALLLLDEPLSNLDSFLRRTLRSEIARLHSELNFTAVYVTHDKSEALTLADEVYVLNSGRIEQRGTPSAVYLSPSSAYTAGFFEANCTDAVVTVRDNSEAFAETWFGRFTTDVQQDGTPAIVAVHPQHVQLERDEDGQGQVVLSQFAGSHHEYEVLPWADESAPSSSQTAGLLRVSGDRTVSELPVGARVRITVAPQHAHVYPGQAASELGPRYVRKDHQLSATRPVIN